MHGRESRGCWGLCDARSDAVPPRALALPEGLRRARVALGGPADVVREADGGAGEIEAALLASRPGHAALGRCARHRVEGVLLHLQNAADDHLRRRRWCE